MNWRYDALHKEVLDDLKVVPRLVTSVLSIVLSNELGRNRTCGFDNACLGE